jgi:hypothetical protein
MTEQFELSKKIIKEHLKAEIVDTDKWGTIPMIKDIDTGSSCSERTHFIFAPEDVKEFIRELKQDANKIFEDSYTLTKYQFDKILKERAGKELIEDNQLNQTGGNTKNGNN